ncbi:MAG TPA: sialidase family protein [Pyrinomonadaceae bacterium]
MRTQTIILCLALLALTGCARPTQQSAQPTTNAGAGPTAAAAPQAVRISAEGTDAAEPALVAGRAGTAFVSWVEHAADGGADVFVRHVSADGTPLAAPVRVNAERGAATAWHGDPPTLAFAPDGTLYIGWTARDPAKEHATALYLSVSHDDGQTFAPPVQVNDDRRPAEHGLHSLAVGADGRVYVVWLDERNVAAPPASTSKTEHQHGEANRDVFFAYSTDGGKTFTPNRRLATEACPCCKTALAVGRDGRLYASWRQVLPGNFRHIAVASSADGGETFAPPVVVSDDQWQLSGCPVSGAALHPAADGALLVVWYTAGERGAPGLYWAESRDGGRTFSARQQLNAGSVHGTPVLLAAEGQEQLRAVWQVGGGKTGIRLATRGQAGWDVSSAPLIDAGEVPAADLSGAHLLVAYAGKAGDFRGVWVAQSDLPRG